MRPGLAKLLQPFPEADFLARHWEPGEPLVVHGERDELAALPELQSAASILAACRGTSVTAIMPDRRDESHSVQVTPDVAAKLFAAGMNMSVGSAERYFPSLRVWLDNLMLDLGLPRTTWGRCIVYVSPANTGAPPHFDPNVNFQLQIKGRKTWTVAPNENVSFPTERHVMKLDEPSPALVAQLHADVELPIAMPQSARAIELVPGSVLFVPRGHWHTTFAEEETIALNFTFGQPSWASLVANALMVRLHRHEAWRKTPNLRAASATETARPLAEARDLLADLRRQLAGMEPHDLVRAASPHLEAYRPKRGVALRREGDRAVLHVEGRDLELETTPDYLPLLDFMFGASGWFGVDDVVGRNDGRVHPTDIAILLARFVDAGALEREPRDG